MLPSIAQFSSRIISGHEDNCKETGAKEKEDNYKEADAKEKEDHL